MTFKYGAIFALGDGPLVDPRPLLDARRRGAPGEPRLRRRDAVRQAADRAREARRPPHDPRSRDGDPGPRHHASAPTLFGDAALGDPIPPLSAIGFALWVGCIALFFGGLAFALSPLLGRAGAAGVASLAMMVLWLGERPRHASARRGHSARSAGRPTTSRSSAGTTGSRSASSASAPPSSSRIGVELFVRRDLGVTSGLSLPRLPASVLGVHGPTSRAFGDLLPRALSWGIGLGLVGAIVASLVGPIADQLGADASLHEDVRRDLPGLRPRTRRVAGSSCTSSCCSSRRGSGRHVRRRSGRPTRPTAGSRRCSRPRCRAPAGCSPAASPRLIAVAVMTVLFALGVGLGAVVRRRLGRRRDARVRRARPLRRGASSASGVAVGGLWRTSLAAEIAALVVVATYLIDLLAPALKLPDWVHQLALTAHFGQPMVGDLGRAGVIACVVVAVGGILLGRLGHRPAGRRLSPGSTSPGAHVDSWRARLPTIAAMAGIALLPLTTPRLTLRPLRPAMPHRPRRLPRRPRSRPIPGLAAAVHPGGRPRR